MTFEDIEADIANLRRQLDTCERKLSKVLKESEENLQQPFSDVMSSFLEQSRGEIAEQEQSLMECKKRCGGILNNEDIFKCELNAFIEVTQRLLLTIV